MKPRLVVLSGVRAGTEFPLGTEPFLIGRDQDADLSLTDRMISRQHARVSFENGEHYIEDLRSQNGTAVNAELIEARRALRSVDRISIGPVTVAYLTADEEISPEPPVFLVEGNPIANVETLVMERRSALLTTTVDVARALRGKPEEFRDRLLDVVFSTTPADRASIVISRGEKLNVICGRDRTDPARPVRVSSTIVRKVIRDGAEVMSNDLAASGMGSIPSIKAAQVQSIICVPLEIFGDRFGAIYADAFLPDSRFDNTHLELLTVVSTHAAAAFRHATDIEDLETQKSVLQDDLNVPHEFIGSNPGIRELRSLIGRTGPSDSTVLIAGESGTGKELVARSLHRSSRRSNRVFVAINCAAIPGDLLESTLFGHEKGAFTGATAAIKGKFELANGGTLFLDEIGELPLSLQSKLLRVLQEREIDRVGGRQPVSIDVRIIAATNRNLEEAIAKGEFRSDLYYRLNVIPIHIPPLRERPDDIPALANHFVEKHRKKATRLILGLSSGAVSMLQNHYWPGNVRELENMIERAIVVGQSETILPEDFLAPAVFSRPGDAQPRQQSRVESKRDLYENALIRFHGDYKAAADSLFVSRSNFHRSLKRMGLMHHLKRAPKSSRRSQMTSSSS